MRPGSSASARLPSIGGVNQYGAMSPSEAERPKELEKENARLKKLVAEQALDIDILKEVSRGNF
jgi:putative transposase